MNTATINHHRPMLPVLNLLVAGAALTLGVVAIATDDASSITPQPRPVVTTPAVEAPPAPALPRADAGSVADRADDCLTARPGVVRRC
jgi:hypothetical protein